MLGMAKRLGIPILQASTSEIYGDPDVHPQMEDYRGLVSISGPRACYDEGKRCAETLFYDYRRRHGVEIRVARIFNTYGPRMNPNDGRVISNFIVQALRNEPITLYGDGRQTRAFCFADDMVEGLMRLMNVAEAPTSAVNLGNPVEISVREIADLIVSLTNSRSEIEFRPLPQDDPRQRCPDITKARELLHWSPKIALEDGLIRTISYFDRLLSAVPKPVRRMKTAQAS
jgi:UDP-glucuronate decarboxylase